MEIFKPIAIILMTIVSMSFSYGQVRLSGRVLNSETNEPMPYVNIGISGKNIGTVSNQNGSFSIRIPENHLKDSLTFSAIGFQQETYRIADLSGNKKDIFFLVPKIHELREVVINANPEIKKYGLTWQMPLVAGYAESKELQDIFEVGQLINAGEKESKVISVHLYVRPLNIDSAVFRINFYAFDGTKPAGRITEKEILIKSRVTKGWLSINLEENNIYVKNQFVCSFEFLPATRFSKPSLYYGGILPSLGTSYTRISSLGEWKKLNFGTYSLYVTVKQ